MRSSALAFALWLLVRPAAAEIIDFEGFAAGEIVSSAAGLSISATNNDSSKTPAAVVFDSACPGGCTGGDSDLGTPGFGTGNTTAQGHILVIASDVVDTSPADGLVDDPDDERHGGTLRFSFARPTKIRSLRVIDVETSAAGSRLEVSNADGSTQVVAFALLGDGSAQTVVVPDARAATSFTVYLAESGGIDDLDVSGPCGDGVVDPGEECDDGDPSQPCCLDDCTLPPSLEPCDDGDSCTSDDVCDAAGNCTGTSASCGDGVVQGECGEECDDGNGENGDCCSATCRAEIAGQACASDGNECTADVCDGVGACAHTGVGAGTPCDDGSLCTTGDACSQGTCVPGAQLPCDDGNDCTDDSCAAASGCVFVNDDTNECDNGDPTDDPDICVDGVCQGDDGCRGDDANCDDGNACTDDVCLASGDCDHPANAAVCDDGNPCTAGESCVLGTCGAGTPTDCDDGNLCTNDTCDPAIGCMSSPNSAACDDGEFCNGADTCAGGVCTHSGDPCVAGESCRSTCMESTDVCLDPAGTPCDDGEFCTPTDACDGAGQCVGGGTRCGDEVLDVECGEQCDPPSADVCTDMCVSLIVCGDGVIDVGEECDDGNDNPEDGCADCVLENLLCFDGVSPFSSRAAARIVFASERNYTGENPDGNQEIFLFERRRFRRATRRGAEKVAALAESITQLTDTHPPTVNEQPSASGSARFVAFVSDGDVVGVGRNADGNREIFHVDRRRSTLSQVTDSRDIDNLHPALRLLRGRMLVFDSPGDLVPDVCVGPRSEFITCSTDADCPDAGVCGNREGNREVFRWMRNARTVRGRSNALRQLTAAVDGDSIVGNSVNFFTRAAAFASSADLVGSNSDRSREIYRIIRKAGNTKQITEIADGQSSAETPAQAQKRRIAFASDADLAGNNADGNMEIFVWSERSGGSFEQITETVGCTNAAPAIDSVATLVAFQSTCDLVPSKGNPDQSIFVYSLRGRRLSTQLVIRGPGDVASARPAVSRGGRVVVYEADPGAGAPNQVCIFDTRKGLLESIF